jgi:uncharacterized protein (TIGR02996 family)
MRRFQFSDGSSHKFWEIDLKGNSYTIRYGRIGTNGATIEKSWPTEEIAENEAGKLIREKTRKGYIEIGGSVESTIPGDSSSLAFEKALQTNPDDLAGWSAFADYLTEQQDPRAEFMRVQLALEDESLTKAERTALSKTEQKLFKANRRLYLGAELEDALIVKKEYPVAESNIRFHRGWLAELHNINLSESSQEEGELIDAFRQSSEARFLNELHFEYIASSFDLSPLASAPFCQSLRKFRVGEDEFRTHASGTGIPALVAACPRLESVIICAHGVDSNKLFSSPMPNVVELALNCNTNYQLAVLARNKSLKKLQILQFRPHADEGDEQAYLNSEGLELLGKSAYLTSLKQLSYHLWDGGDDMAEALIETGLLFRLEVLNLQHGNLTDAGAEQILEALQAEKHQLKTLILNDNALESEETLIDEFSELGIELQADSQHSGDGDEYLYNGDIE